MSKYEDLKVWQIAHELVLDIYRITAQSQAQNNTGWDDNLGGLLLPFLLTWQREREGPAAENYGTSLA